MRSKMAIAFLAMGLIAVGLAACNNQSAADQPMTQAELVKRGEHIVRVSDCGVCHTPKIMTDHGPVEDSSKLFAGHLADDPIPAYPAEFLATSGWIGATNPNFTAWAGPWGISFASNLTPHQVFGSGAWTEEAFMQAMRNGKHLGNGRPLLPPMPWGAVSHHTDEDLRAIFAFLQSIPAIDNQVPQPVPPTPAGEMSAK